MRDGHRATPRRLIEPKVIDQDHLTRSDLTSIDFDKVICGESSSTGAMGLAGHVWLYVLKGHSFRLYQTWHESDVKLYGLAWDLVNQNRSRFSFADGGYGNTVFVKKGITLEPSGPVPKEISKLINSDNGKYFWVYDNRYKIKPSGVGLYWSASREWQCGRH